MLFAAHEGGAQSSPLPDGEVEAQQASNLPNVTGKGGAGTSC